jgi:hypothetical protein
LEGSCFLAQKTRPKVTQSPPWAGIAAELRQRNRNLPHLALALGSGDATKAALKRTHSKRWRAPGGSKLGRTWVGAWLAWRKAGGG